MQNKMRVIHAQVERPTPFVQLFVSAAVAHKMQSLTTLKCDFETQNVNENKIYSHKWPSKMQNTGQKAQKVYVLALEK